MRYVYRHGWEMDRTNGHAHCRRWLEDDPAGFLKKLAELEKALASQ
jgi:hypothetical protein